ncbi:MAG: type II toxin-antitoxin system ParD family antitoxin [Planctomycetes bacterium]|nr:type II toxin-antitoxin system ParD family antitoxin [Planctomycetota bacterium]MCC7398919.1 type II toxin-antitoxin system ParD family antitoxin [Planctomycetota bacterium]
MSSLTLNVSLSPQLAKFVRSRVDSGRYATASEVVREALRWFAERARDADDAPTMLDLQEQSIDRERARAAILRLRALRAGTTLGADVTVKDLRDEGRR